MTAPLCVGDVVFQNLAAGERDVRGALFERPDSSHIIVGATGGNDFEPWPGHVEEFDDRDRIFTAVLSDAGDGIETRVYGETADESTQFVDDIFVVDSHVTGDGEIIVLAQAEGAVDFGDGAGPDVPLILLRIDADGEIDWVRQLPQGSFSALSGGCFPGPALAYSAFDDGVVITGCFTDDVPTPPLTLTPSLETTQNVHYVAKFDSSGEVVFARTTITGFGNGDFDIACLNDGTIVYFGSSSGTREWVLDEGNAVDEDDIFAILSPEGSIESVTYAEGLAGFPNATSIDLTASPDDTFWVLRSSSTDEFRLEHRDASGTELSSSTDAQWPAPMQAIETAGDGRLIAMFELGGPTDFGQVTLAPQDDDSRALVVMDTTSTPPAATWGRVLPGFFRFTSAVDGDVLVSRNSFSADAIDLGAGPPPSPTIANFGVDSFVARIQGE